MKTEDRRSPARGLLSPLVSSIKERNKEEDRDTLIRLLEVVLEQLAFVFTEEAEKEELIVQDGNYIHVAMSYTGTGSHSHKGHIEIAMPIEMSFLVAANILGIDDQEMIKKSADDAARELLNIYCGQVLTTLFSTDEIFDLMIPEVTPFGADEWNVMVDNPDTIGVKIEEFPFLMLLSIRN